MSLLLYRLSYEPTKFHRIIPICPKKYKLLIERHRQEMLQFSGPCRVAEFSQRLCLDLPHALAGNLEDRPDLFEGPRIPVAYPEPQPQHLLLSLGQRAEDSVHLLP